MVSKPDLRVTNGYIIGVSQRLVCSGVVCTQILGHLSLWLSGARRSVALFSGRATLERCQNLRTTVTAPHRSFTLKDKTAVILYFSFCEQIPWKIKIVLYDNFPVLSIPSYWMYIFTLIWFNFLFILKKEGVFFKVCCCGLWLFMD